MSELKLEDIPVQAAARSEYARARREERIKAVVYPLVTFLALLLAWQYLVQAVRRAGVHPAGADASSCCKLVQARRARSASTRW